MMVGAGAGVGGYHRYVIGQASIVIAGFALQISLQTVKLQSM